MTFMFKARLGAFVVAAASNAVVSEGLADGSLRPRATRYVFIGPEAADSDGLVAEKAAAVACDVCANVLEACLAGMDTKQWGQREAVLHQLRATSQDFSSASDDELEDILTLPRWERKEFRELEKHVLRHQQGCNRHFRRELLDTGAVVGSCGRKASGRNPAQTWCLEQQRNLTDNTPFVQPARELLRFDSGREALYVACERTIGLRGSELAQALPRMLKRPGALVDIEATLRETCREAADCEDSAAINGWREQGRRRRKKKKRGKRADADL
eukprot:TRINITY_DN111797_c0_g1_i1.p1 TRINITY_DN111797_c0_g1~~TRINITY_DN111797_c0_g1_i1.p1  ORF type:complete len:272 (-),score=55.31 TRINITY_DN111797_c0_g1_i1:86-901(-)